MTLEEFNDLYYNPHSSFGIDTFELYETHQLFKECLLSFTSDNIFFIEYDLILIKEDFFVVIAHEDIKQHETYSALKTLLNMSKNQKWLITRFNKNKNLLKDLDLIKYIGRLNKEQVDELVEAVDFLIKVKATLMNSTGRVITYRFEDNYCTLVCELNLTSIEQSLQTFYIIQSTIKKLKFDEMIGESL